MATDFTNLDPQVVSLAKAIRTTESNNNYQAVGDNGDSHGAYQFNKGNFAHWASQAGLDPNDFSPVNQDKVAYAKIKSWKDQGYHAGEIAAMWNGAHLDSNNRPVANKPQYVAKVQQALQTTSSNSYNPKPFSQPTPGNKINLNPPTINPPAGDNASSGNQVIENNNGLGDVFKGIGKGLLNGAKGIVEPELKAVASGARALQATPQVLGAVYNAASGQDYSQYHEADQTMAKPVLGQKTLGGSSIDQNLGSAANAALQGTAVKIPDLPSIIENGGSTAKGLLQKLVPKSTAGKIIGGVLLDKAISSGPIKGLLKTLLGL